MRIMLVVLTASLAVLLASVPSAAHHAFAAEFDVNQPIELRGTITKVEWINPHSWFHLEVRGEDGNAVNWMVEGGSPNALIRRGINRTTVPPGMELVVIGYRSKDGMNKAVGMNFTLPSGERLFLDGSAAAPDAPRQQ